MRRGGWVNTGDDEDYLGPRYTKPNKPLLSNQTWRRLRHGLDFLWYWGFTLVSVYWAVGSFRTGDDWGVAIFTAAALILANHAQDAHRKMTKAKP